MEKYLRRQSFLEQALGMYDPGIYLPSSTLLPTEYSQPTGKWSHHFFTLYIWLILVGISLLVLTWTGAHIKKDDSLTNKTEQIEGGKSNG